MVVGHQFRPDRKSGLWTPNQKPYKPVINWQHPIVRRRSIAAYYPIAQYEAGGNQIFDIAGNNTGAFGNDPAWVAGQDGPAIELDGGDDYITLPNASTLLTDDDNWTIVVGFRYLGAALIAAIQRLISFDRNNTGGSAILFDMREDDDTLSLVYHDGGGFNVLVIETLANLGNSDHTVIVTYDGTTFRTYLDGIPDATAVDTFAGFGDGSTRIGTNSVAGDLFFDGLINYVPLFNRALSASEIFQLNWDKYCFIESPWPNRGALWVTAAVGHNVAIIEHHLRMMRNRNVG